MAKLLTQATAETITKKSVINKMLADAVVNNSHDLEIHDNEFTLSISNNELSLDITCTADITIDDDATMIQNVIAFELLIDDGEINFDSNTNYINYFTDLSSVAKQVIDKFECDNGVYLLDDEQVASHVVQELNNEARDSREYNRDPMKYVGMYADFA